MREVLSKMLSGCEAYLDSENLIDLRLLISDGVLKADVLVILGSKHVLSRPWCLLEMFEAVQKGIPVVLVLMKGNPLDIDEAFKFIDTLETSLDKVNPGAYQQLVTYVGSKRMRLLKATLRSMLEGCNEAGVKWWHPHASDASIVADAMDICEAMAEATEQKLVWHEASYGRGDISKRGLAQDSTGRTPRLHAARFHVGKPLWFLRKGFGDPNMRRATTVYLTCAEADAGSDARVLQAALLQHAQLLVVYHHADGGDAGDDLGKEGSVSQSTAAARPVAECDALILLQTSGSLTSVSVLMDLWEAFKHEKPILPLVLDDPSRKYDFESARKICEHLTFELAHCAPEVLRELSARLGESSYEEFETALRALPLMISHIWNPLGSENHYKGMSSDILKRLHAAKSHPKALPVSIQGSGSGDWEQTSRRRLHSLHALGSISRSMRSFQTSHVSSSSARLHAQSGHASACASAASAAVEVIIESTSADS
mmetsp:Transcript_27319/g.55000  ORF Transcript_27319/g.55000 Transcript_27319/m.55000 type:complete len:485 (-) Transcript_27319:453-1907(-)